MLACWRRQPLRCLALSLGCHTRKVSETLCLALQGLEKSFDYKKVLKAFKKGKLLLLLLLGRWHLQHASSSDHVSAAEFCCNGNVVEDAELGKVIQLQGDQRKNVSTFLTGNNLAKKDLIKIHGF